MTMHQTHARSIKDYCLNLCATDLSSDTFITMTKVEWPEVSDDVTAEWCSMARPDDYLHPGTELMSPQSPYLSVVCK